MAAGATYEPIASTTVAVAAASITFSSIPSTYTDLRFVLTSTASIGGSQSKITLNGLTTAIYSVTGLYGSGTTATSGTTNGNNFINLDTLGASSTIPTLITLDLLSYAGSTYKTIMWQANEDRNGSGYVSDYVGLIQTTAAITSLTVAQNSGTYNVGTTATLYGIKAA
jgi:hypothetical protein